MVGSAKNLTCGPAVRTSTVPHIGVAAFRRRSMVIVELAEDIAEMAVPTAAP